MSPDFTRTFNLYQLPILRYCTWKCRDSAIGENMTQEIFLRFWLCLQRREKILHERAFLYKIAHNLIVDYVRKKKETSLDQLLEAGFEPSVDMWHETYNRLDALRPLSKLGKMNGPYRKVLGQRYLKGLRPAEIAKQTGESTNAVSVRIFRGLKRLRLMLEPTETGTLVVAGGPW